MIKKFEQYKKFENIIEYNNDVKKYKVGDYVLISGQLYASGKDVPVKLIRELLFKNSGNYEHLYMDGFKGVSEYKYIKRYLTKSEIEYFNTYKYIKNFNL